MSIHPIVSDQAPTPMGTYSQAIIANGFLFVSGQLPLSRDTQELISEDPIVQIQQCLDNIQDICLAAGTALQNAVKINVYYTDIVVSENLNSVMEQYFTSPYPARIRVQVAGLSKNAKVEIDGVFLCPAP